MSMMGTPPARGEVGETVASFPTYEGAQKAVSNLVAHDVPAREIAIVGSGLRSIERVTGRLGYATAARTGAINGLLLGLFFSAIFVLGNTAVPISAFIGVMFVGIAIGMLLSIVSYSIVRRRRDFASVMQVVADHYDVTVLPTSIHRARQILGPVTTVARPETTSSAPPAGGSDELPQEPPRYGERIVPGAERPSAGHDADRPSVEAGGDASPGAESPTDDGSSSRGAGDGSGGTDASDPSR